MLRLANCPSHYSNYNFLGQKVDCTRQLCLAIVDCNGLSTTDLLIDKDIFEVSVNREESKRLFALTRSLSIHVIRSH